MEKSLSLHSLLGFKHMFSKNQLELFILTCSLQQSYNIVYCHIFFLADGLLFKNHATLT